MTPVIQLRWLARMARTVKVEETALEIFRERYTCYEIDREEFDQKKRDLL